MKFIRIIALLVGIGFMWFVTRPKPVEPVRHEAKSVQQQPQNKRESSKPSTPVKGKKTTADPRADQDVLRRAESLEKALKRAAETANNTQSDTRSKL